MSVILIIVLLIIATVLITSLLNGTMTRMLQKPALVTVQADQFDTTGGAHIISLYHQGEHVILNGTSQADGVSIITSSLISPSGSTFPLGKLNPMSQRAWQPGDMLYIYQNGGSYGFSDTAPTGVASLATGTWKIIIQDDKVHVLLHTLPVTIK